jgi:hypothetical protein
VPQARNKNEIAAAIPTNAANVMTSITKALQNCDALVAHIEDNMRS